MSSLGWVEKSVRQCVIKGLEAVAVIKRQEAELEMAETKMLMVSLTVMLMDRINTEYIRGTAR